MNNVRAAGSTVLLILGVMATSSFMYQANWITLLYGLIAIFAATVFFYRGMKE